MIPVSTMLMDLSRVHVHKEKWISAILERSLMDITKYHTKNKNINSLLSINEPTDIAQW